VSQKKSMETTETQKEEGQCCSDSACCANEAIKNMTDTVYQTAKPTIDMVTGKVNEFKEMAAGKVQDMRSQAQAAWGDAACKARNFQSQSEDYIRANPLQAIGIALGVGLLIGLVSRR